MRGRWLLLVTLLALMAGANAQPLRIYVAPDGNDRWSGRLVRPNAWRTDGPLATLTWVGFVSNATDTSVFYLDDMELTRTAR